MKPRGRDIIYFEYVIFENNKRMDGCWFGTYFCLVFSRPKLEPRFERVGVPRAASRWALTNIGHKAVVIVAPRNSTAKGGWGKTGAFEPLLWAGSLSGDDGVPS